MTYYEGGEVSAGSGDDTPTAWLEEVDFYLSTDRKWHWRVRAANGQIFAASHQGFVFKNSAKRNYRRSIRG